MALLAIGVVIDTIYCAVSMHGVVDRVVST